MVKVLVVDDEQVALLDISSSLRRAGYEVKIARSGHEAVALASTFRPEVVVTDLRLQGGIDGIDLVRRLSQAQPRLRSVVFSGVPISELRQRCASLPGAKVLSKPFPHHELLRSIRDLARSP